MKWFSGLKRNVRIFITVISYLPFIIISTLAGGDVENLSGFMYAVSLIFIILPIVITVFAVKADKNKRRERQAQILKEMNEFSERKRAEEKEKFIAKKLSMIADKKCPSCGGTIGYNEKTDTYACDFCGTPFSLK